MRDHRLSFLDDRDSSPHGCFTPQHEEIQQRELERRAAMFSFSREEDFSLFSPPLSPPQTHGQGRTRGGYRYLKGCDLDDTVYDYAIITRRRLETTHYSPDKEVVHQRILDQLTQNGLDVDIMEGGFSPMANGEQSSLYFVLLVRASDELLRLHAHKLRIQTWLRSGMSQEIDTVMHENSIMTPAERIQVVDHIVREEARLMTRDEAIHSMFPIHDDKANEYLLKTFIKSGKLEHLSESFLGNIKTYFGEKVAFYFAFMDFYNKSLFPIAVVGVLLTAFRGLMGTVVYMRVLIFWGFFVSVVWSFWFLKSWNRRNNVLNYLWKKSLQKKTIMYRNPDFVGSQALNPITGLPDQSYPNWKRYPKYLISLFFMCCQIMIMMVVIAFWITVFEIIKVRYPNSGLFSVQWFSILTGGVVFGLFVDIVQWMYIVTKAARLLTRWENWKTLEVFEIALIRKLFVMDFLNYYTWFFLLAFVYVIPGCGDSITNFLNSALWKDPANCCFGPYLDPTDSKHCQSCPAPWYSIDGSGRPQDGKCVPCKGPVTFDRGHLDIEKLFITPIIITQGLNLLIAVLVPWIHRKHHEQSLRMADRKAMQMVRARGPRQLLGDMHYHLEQEEDRMVLSNHSKARYLENDDTQVEKLNAKARNILFQSEQEDYDPYDDYHCATVQFGFVVMFSMLWPPMPMACIVINALKLRGDGFRLCQTLKRPFPRQASGIGEWENVLYVLAGVGVVVYVGLIFISTGAIEFFSPHCIEIIWEKMVAKDWNNFRFGPCFECLSMTKRIVILLVTEHLVFVLVWFFWKMRHNVPGWLEIQTLKEEYEFKLKLYRKTLRSPALNAPNAPNVHSGSGGGVNSTRVDGGADNGMVGVSNVFMAPVPMVNTVQSPLAAGSSSASTATVKKAKSRKSLNGASKKNQNRHQEMEPLLTSSQSVLVEAWEQGADSTQKQKSNE